MTLYSDIYLDTYLDTYGAPFPGNPLGIGCDLLLNNSWTDTSGFVYQRLGSSPPIAITRGKPNESSGITPADARWEWKNTDGRFSPRNPNGPYYKQLIRNTPVRFSVPALANYLRLEPTSPSASASVAENSTLHVTGSIELRMAVRLTDWSGCILAARYDGATPVWYFTLASNGTLNLSWFDSGGTLRGNSSSVPLPYTSGDMAIRVTMDATTGNIKFYTAATIDGSYTQIGPTVSGVSGATSIRAGNAPLVVGYSTNTPGTFGLTNNQMYGRVYEFRMYNGIAGSVVADAIFSAVGSGYTSFVDSASNTWNVNGSAEISGRDYRFHGQMSSIPPNWDKTANDMAVQAEAGGPLRLIGQASNGPLNSPMYRAAVSQTGTLLPVAYWPMEDGTTAHNFGPAVGPNALNWGSVAPNLASNSDFICSAPLCTLNNSGPQGAIQPYNGAPWNANGTTWSIQWLMEVKTLPASGSITFFQINVSSGAASYIAVGIDSSGNMIMNVYDANVNIIASLGPISYGNIQQPTLWSVTSSPSGSNVNVALSSIPVGANTGLTASVNTSSTGHAGYASYIYITPFGGFSDMVFGHVLVQVPVVSIFNLLGPLNAWNGEQAAIRFARLCTENGWPVRILGPSFVSAIMGPQSMETFESLLEECETADMGQMFECRQVLGLGYRTLASILNQTPALSISYTTATISGAGESEASGLAPTYDDLLINNDFTVIQGNQQRTGASYRAQLNDGSEMSVSVAGDYQESPTLNLALATQLPDAANWLVHMGTVNEARWANIPFNLARAQLATFLPNLMALEIGDSISITSLPTNVTYDPIGQVAIGYTEDLGAYYWWIQTNNAPASPYNTGIFDDPVYGRADTDGSTLTSPITSGATSFQVSTTTANTPVWTTAAGDFPFDINIGGERMTVSNITSSTSPQTFTISARAVNGVAKAHLAGDDVRLWFPPIYASI